MYAACDTLAGIIGRVAHTTRPHNIMEQCRHGNTGRCKQCDTNARHLRWRDKHLEEARQYNKEWMAQSRGGRKRVVNLPNCGDSTCNACDKCKNRIYMQEKRQKDKVKKWHLLIT